MQFVLWQTICEIMIAPSGNKFQLVTVCNQLIVGFRTNDASTFKRMILLIGYVEFSLL